MNVLIVSFRVHAQHAEDFAAAIVANARTSLADEPGCSVFDVCRSASDPTLFMLYELYADDAAVREHLASPHFHRFDALSRPWVAEKTVWSLQRVEPADRA